MNLSLPLLLVLAQTVTPPPGASAANDPCAFTISPIPSRVEITGSEATAKHSSVVNQPDSPLRIVRVDLSRATFSGAGGGMITFDVLNASNRPIRGGSLGFLWQVGFKSVAGSANFTNEVSPSGTIRVEAKLPETGGQTSTVASVVMNVRSANVDGCTYEPSRATARIVSGRHGYVPPPAGTACAFTVAADDTPARFAGPADIVARLRPMAQPGSPLRVVGVDASKLRLNVGESWLQLRGSYTLDVRNVSDRTIEIALVGLLTFAGGPTGGTGADWRAPLAPGKTATLKQDVASIADFQPGTTAADVRLVPIVSTVLFDTCSYKPAWAYPTKVSR